MYLEEELRCLRGAAYRRFIYCDADHRKQVIFHNGTMAQINLNKIVVPTLLHNAGNVYLLVAVLQDDYTRKYQDFLSSGIALDATTGVMLLEQRLQDFETE